MTVNFSTQYTKRTYAWTQFKQFLALRKAALQSEDFGSYYTLWFYDGPEVFTCDIWKDPTPDDILTQFGIDQTQADADKAEFEAAYLPLANQSINKLDDNHRPLTVPEPRVGDETIYTTHNFCDKSTWFADSIRETDKVLTSNDGFKWESGDLFWVDMISGRVQDDDGLVDEQKTLNPGNPHGYQVIVTVDGVEKTMREPLETTGGDYEVFWEDGYVKSFEDWTGQTVLASYSHATSSTFILEPLPGRDLNIEAAEADFSEDVIMNDAIEYSVYGYAAVFAPQLGLPEGTRIPLSTVKYKRLSQILNEAIGSYPVVGVYGSAIETRNLPQIEYRRQQRGLKSFVQSIPFRYATVRGLKSLYGIQLRVKLTHDRAFDGSLATLTFYCTSVPGTP